MAISAFVVKVPAAEPLVHDLRQRHDASAVLGVPAHITLLVPFMDPAQLTSEVLARAQQALRRHQAFSFLLGKVGRFPETTYLAPEPAAPFIAMTRSLVDAFPGFLPYGGEHQGVVPHLTVAHGHAEAATTVADALLSRLLASGPVSAHCAEAVLLGNSTGRWEELHAFPLAAAPAPDRISH